MKSTLTTGIAQLKKRLSQLVCIPESEWRYATQFFSECTFEKEAFLVRAGEKADNFYFIVQGLVRFFYATESGKEYNKHFAKENDFAGAMHALVLGAPSRFFIQAFEKTHTIVLPNDGLNALYERHACWERLGRKNAEYLALQKEARERAFLLDSLPTRYRHFVTHYPGLLDRLPQYHIASYLGVTDVALSRIRAKM
jgi:CRP-like cAMP-binding protein